MSSNAERARVIARAGTPPTPLPAAAEPDAWEMTARALKAILRRVEALEGANRTRAERNIAAYHVSPSGQLILNLQSGAVEIAGIVREGD